MKKKYETVCHVPFLCHSCQVKPFGEWKKPGRREKLHYRRIDTETQGDNFILIFWVNTRIINLDYGRKVDAAFLLPFTSIH